MLDKRLADSSYKCNKWSAEEYLIRRLVAERLAWTMVKPFYYLVELPDLGKIEEVAADAAGGLDRAQKEVLPNAVRTKGRHHVRRLANTAVDEVRRAVTPGREGRKKGRKGMCPSHVLRKRNFQLKDHERAVLQWCLGLYPELASLKRRAAEARRVRQSSSLACSVWSHRRRDLHGLAGLKPIYATQSVVAESVYS